MVLRVGSQTWHSPLPVHYTQRSNDRTTLYSSDRTVSMDMDISYMNHVQVRS